MDIAVTKMSSKGQIVIPVEMRKGLKEGDKLVVIRKKGSLILRKASEVEKNFEEELLFAKRTEEAFKRYQKGEFIEMDFDEFIEKAKKW